jgi:hypothetical protein
MTCSAHAIVVAVVCVPAASIVKTLVAHLLVGQALAGLLVARHQHHRRQVAPIGPVAPVVGDDPVNDGVQAADGRVEPAVVAGGQPFQQVGRGQHALADAVEQDRQGPDDLVDDVLVEIGREQRRADDRHGQFHHLHVGLDRRVGPPRLGPRRGQPLHHLGVARDPPGVEGRLEQPAVPGVGRPAQCDQAVADERPDLLQQQAGLELRRVGDQHATNQIGAVHDVGRPRTQPDRDDISHRTQRFQKLQRLAAKSQRVAKNG